MEQKNISFGKGIQRSPSLAADGGELSECVNLIPKNGELVNLQPAEEIGVKVEGTLMCVHRVNNEVHYITRRGDELVFFTEKDSDGTPICEISETAKVQPMGDILVIVDKIATYYAIWEYDDDISRYEYKYYDTIPDLQMDFFLVGKAEHAGYENVAALVQGIDENTTLKPVMSFKEYFQAEQDESAPDFIFTTEMLASKGFVEGRKYRIKDVVYYGIVYVDSAIGGNITVRTRQVADFIMHSDTTIRVHGETGEVISFQIYEVIETAEGEEDSVGYAVNNKDESHLTAIMGSVMDFINVYSYEQKQFIFPFFVRYGLRMVDNTVIKQSAPVLMIPNSGIVPACAITRLRSNTSEEGTALSNLSMMAYACKLHYRINNADDFEKWKSLIVGIDIAVSAPLYRIDEGVLWNKSVNHFKVRHIENLKESYGILNEQKRILLEEEDLKGELNTDYGIIIPSKPESTYLDELISTSVFYTIAQYDFTELKNESEVNMDSVNLKTLTTLPQMTDDIASHSQYTAEDIFVYNKRLHLANIKETLTAGLSELSPVRDSYNYLYRIIVKGVADGQEYTVATEWKKGNILDASYIYANVKGALKAIIHYGGFNIFGDKTTRYFKKELSLKPHPRLAGAYYTCYPSSIYNGYLDLGEPLSDEEREKDYATMPHTLNGVDKIIQSNVGNPFVFSGELQRSIGTGEIKKVSTAAKALSSGTQHGAFPLICFADDGVWHLKVNSDGTYSTPNPTSRDILTNTGSVVQLDSAVVFATDRGLMKIDGSSVKLLSGAMEGENVNEDIFFADLKGTEHGKLIVRDTESLVSMLKDCKTLWDYSNGLIHIYTGRNKHYVYSIEADAWSEYAGDESNPVAVVHDYPYSILQREDGMLMQYRKNEDLEVTRNGIILTRETAFDDPFTMKMLADLRMLYTKHKGTKCSIKVYVSNDREHWHVLKSLRSHSWKWYRFRIRTMLTDLDALTGLSCWVEARRTNKMR